jgi:hypothetical protein
MKRKFIPAERTFQQWKKDPKHVAAYETLEKEFALASALVETRSKADVTKEMADALRQ